MDLRTLTNTVIDSSPEDWHLIASAPTFRDHLEFHPVYVGQPNVLHAASHHSVGVYIPDVSITIAWGLERNKDFNADWCKNFPDPKAHAGFFDMFFNSALVYRALYVWVDGVFLPLPFHTKDAKLQVTKRACELMKVIDRMGRSPRPDFHAYEQDVDRAGFTVVDEDWPTFPQKELGPIEGW